ncbi:TlpA disulfide reductase family protein [Allomuricauda sp. d1]|uniref:peroxiredoxin family protein n=1 Tax=Allomuricauda sp. d1 TaxID=3136725 RepID=UPI0031D84F89
MQKTFFFIVVLSVLFSCKQKGQDSPKLVEGDWLGQLQVSDTEVLPFNFTLSYLNDTPVIKMYNADEVITVDEIETKGDSILIQMPVFEGYIAGIFSADVITGDFIKESLNRIVPFSARPGDLPRFSTNQDASVDVSGVWETYFDYDTDAPYAAKGIFEQEGNKVMGTFRTKTGDYRYLEGVVEGDSLKLSTFDGAHAFLFTAKVSDSTLEGAFYSGNHSVEKFRANRNADFELPDANTLTYLNEGYDSFEFSFPNADGQMVGLKDGEYKDKVVLVQIMGTWCPNCLDETKFYVDYLKKNPNEDLKIVALAFEYAKTEEKAFEGIKRLKERIDVPYPILLAQYGTSNKIKANEKLPALNHVLSYPTTIYINKAGKVKKIHTGFNGPATGEKHESFKREFHKTVQELLTG